MKMEKNVGTVFDLNESSRFSLEYDNAVTNSRGEKEIKILFKVNITTELSTSLKKKDIEFNWDGFDGDGAEDFGIEVGEMRYWLYLMGEQAHFFKFWLINPPYYSLDVIDFDVIEVDGKNILEILTIFTYIEPDFFGDPDDDEDEEWEEDYFYDDLEDQKIRLKKRITFIENGIEKIKVIDLANIKYGNVFGKVYTYLARQLEASRGDIIFLKKYERDPLIAVSDVKIIKLDDLGFPLDMIKSAEYVFEKKNISDMEVIEHISVENSKFRYETRFMKVNNQKVDLELLTNSMFNLDYINIVGVTKGSGKKIYYMGANGFDLGQGEKVICGYPKEEFIGTVRENTRAIKISELPVPLTRLLYVKQRNSSGKSK